MSLQDIPLGECLSSTQAAELDAEINNRKSLQH